MRGAKARGKGEFLDLERAADLDALQLGELWRVYHAEKHAISAVIPVKASAGPCRAAVGARPNPPPRSRTSRWRRGPPRPLSSWCRWCGTRVRGPVPHPARGPRRCQLPPGYELYLLQWQRQQCAGTSLLEYKTHQDNARPLVLLNHYTEFAESRGVVLMSGECDPGASLLDAQFFANQLKARPPARTTAGPSRGSPLRPAALLLRRRRGVPAGAGLQRPPRRVRLHAGHRPPRGAQVAATSSKLIN